MVFGHKMFKSYDNSSRMTIQLYNLRKANIRFIDNIIIPSKGDDEF